MIKMTRPCPLHKYKYLNYSSSKKIPHAIINCRECSYSFENYRNEDYLEFIFYKELSMYNSGHLSPEDYQTFEVFSKYGMLIYKQDKLFDLNKENIEQLYNLLVLV